MTFWIGQVTFNRSLVPDKWLNFGGEPWYCNTFMVVHVACFLCLFRLVPCGMCPVYSWGMVCKCTDNGTYHAEKCTTWQIQQGNCSTFILSCVWKLFKPFLFNSQKLKSMAHMTNMMQGFVEHVWLITKYISQAHTALIRLSALLLRL